MDSKSHWEKTYSTKLHTEVSWFTEHVSTALELIHRTNLSKSAPIVDVGGGASTLVDDLLEEGYENLTVMDISDRALDIARQRLRQSASKIHWMEGDVLLSDFNGQSFDLWHDRAVFHFLTDEADRQVYKAQVIRHVKPNGYVVMSVFAEDGPERCSALPVRRHSGKDLADFFGENFSMIFESKTVHVTPTKAEQRFTNMILKRIA